MKPKQVILVIVEGMSDKTVLSGLLPKLFGDYVFRFKIVHGDILTQASVTRDEILAHVNKQLSYAMQEYKYRADDIKEVIHLVDMDGVFINQDNIKEVKEISHIQYGREVMYVKDFSQILRRNKQKTLNLSRLVEATYLKRSNRRIPYSLYYMSINLDHVVCNDPNLPSPYLKAKASYDFVESFRGKESSFIDFTKRLILGEANSYMTSWKAIEDSRHALTRATNLYFFISHLISKM